VAMGVKLRICFLTFRGCYEWKKSNADMLNCMICLLNIVGGI
jgi:hypothetical protein